MFGTTGMRLSYNGIAPPIAPFRAANAEARPVPMKPPEGEELELLRDGRWMAVVDEAIDEFLAGEPR